MTKPYRLTLEDMHEITTDQQSVCPPYTPEEYADIVRTFKAQSSTLEEEESA
jgi:hypothetical protein